MKRTADAFEKYLVSKSLLSQEQLKTLRRERSETNESLKAVCLRAGFLSEEAFAIAEATFLDIPFVKLEDYIFSPDTIKLVPAHIAKKQGAFPLFRIGKTLTLALHDPHNILAVDQVRATTKLEVDVVMATEADIGDAIREYYAMRGIADVAEIAERSVIDNTIAEGVKIEDVKLEISSAAPEIGTEAPIVKLVDETIMQAVEDKASDIHIEPEPDFVRIRCRIDGVLIEVGRFPKNLQSPVISRVKIMAKLDIAENRKPQDGKIRLFANGREIDIRVSSFPTNYGENIVLRILDRSSVILDLGRLGFSPSLLKKFEELLKKPYGIILVTGPTGAGKTTTLYAALQTINSVERNIMTIEDPIEYQMSMIRQTQVNVKAGISFANGLRNLLRQDPDVMLVGEIRDRETAEIAVESALTGHLVFSTLHTNDAPGAITRLLDMGMEPFLISSSVIGALAQRLVRVICPNCRTEYPAKDANLDPRSLEILRNLRNQYFKDAKGASRDQLMLYKGGGCRGCKKTGFRGRVAIFELMLMGDKIRSCISRRSPTSEIRELAFQGGNLSMKEDGFMKVLEGVTTVEEVLKVSTDD